MSDFVSIPESGDPVGTLPNSNIFHVLRKRAGDERMDYISICGNLEDSTSGGVNNQSEYPTLKEANKQGLRLCETCKTTLRNFTELNIRTCIVCSRVNVLTNDIFRTITVPEGPHMGDEVDICKPCRIEIVTINGPTRS